MKAHYGEGFPAGQTAAGSPASGGGADGAARETGALEVWFRSSRHELLRNAWLARTNAFSRFTDARPGQTATRTQIAGQLAPRVGG
jgi:hypothetical protein